jgi:hypothetical protein
MCGGPRIISNFGGETATNALREQKKAFSNARAASVATVVQAMFAAVVTLIGLALLPASIAGKVVVFAIAVVPLILALRSRSRATQARENAKNAGDRAWQAAAEDVAASSKEGVTVPALAKALGIEPAHAEKLLTALTVHDRTRIDVGDDAEVRYSVRPETVVSETADAGVLEDGPLVRVGEEHAGEDELVDETRKAELDGRER